MDLESTDRSRVFVEVRSKGILGALEHHLVFGGPPEPFVVEGVPESGDVDVAVEASVAIAKLLPPPDASAADREKMLDHLRGRDVLDIDRWPTLVLRGRYRGTLERGTLDGELVVRGNARAISLAWRGARVDRGDDASSSRMLRFDATWEGTQTELGLKPFRALMGVLALHDWAKIRLEIELERR